MNAAELRTLRKGMKLTQTQLAARLDMTRSAVADWEGGRRPVPVVVALAVRALTPETSAER